MLNNMNQILGQMQTLQDHLKNMTIEAEAGNGIVRVIMNGQQNLLGVRFNPDTVASVESAALGEMVVQAFTEARSLSKTKAREEVVKVTGLDFASLPGVSGLF